MARITISARIREKKGKEAARKLRKNNEIPAIFYGPDRESTMLAVEHSELLKAVKRVSGESMILDLQIGSNGGSETKTVMLKELQMDPVRDHLLHADFYEVSLDKEITVNIPIHLKNTPMGASKGGILQHIKREVTLCCLPDKLIEHIDVDVSGLDIGESVHIRDITLPEEIRCLEDEAMTVAVVASPAVKSEAELEEAEGETTEAEAEAAEES